MRRQKIAIDIDDVIADSTDTIRRVVNNALGINLTKDDYRTVDSQYWGYYEAVWETHGIHNDITFTEVEERVQGDHPAPLLAGAEYALTLLAEKHDLVLVTARDPKSEDFTKNWLKQHLPDLQLDVYFSANHNIGDRKLSKGEICIELGAVWLIDDNFDHCQSAIDQGLQAILFGDYGWHKGAPDHMQKCPDWPAVVDYFQNN